MTLQVAQSQERDLFRAHTLWNNKNNKTSFTWWCELLLSPYFFLGSKERLKYSLIYWESYNGLILLHTYFSELNFAFYLPAFPLYSTKIPVKTVKLPISNCSKNHSSFYHIYSHCNFFQETKSVLYHCLPSFEIMVIEIKYQSFNISYNLWQVLYYLNSFNILYVDCLAFPFHTVYSLTKVWEETGKKLANKYWPASKTTKHWSWKRKGQNFQNPPSYFMYFRSFKNFRKNLFFNVILRMNN